MTLWKCLCLIVFICIASQASGQFKFKCYEQGSYKRPCNGNNLWLNASFPIQISVEEKVITTLVFDAIDNSGENTLLNGECTLGSCTT